MFGDVVFDAAADYGDSEPIASQLGALADLVKEGKVCSGMLCGMCALSPCATATLT